MGWVCLPIHFQRLLGLPSNDAVDYLVAGAHSSFAEELVTEALQVRTVHSLLPSATQCRMLTPIAPLSSGYENAWRGMTCAAKLEENLVDSNRKATWPGIMQAERVQVDREIYDQLYPPSRTQMTGLSGATGRRSRL